MPTRLRILISIGLLAMASHSLSAQRRTVASFNGAWREADIRIERPDSTLTRPPRTGISVIYNGYFSQIFYAAPAQGVQQTSRPTTAEEKAARFDVVAANAGHFEATDSTTVIHFDFAKALVLVGTSTTARYRLVGDTIWQTTIAPWAKDSTKTVRTTTKFIRVR